MGFNPNFFRGLNNKIEQTVQSIPSIVANTIINKTFADFELSLYDHQRETFNKCINETIGQCSLPTGSGKTKVQIALILRDMVKKNEASELGIYGIASHRLVLNQQLITELVDEANQLGIKFKVLFVGSLKYKSNGKEYEDDVIPEAGQIHLQADDVKSTLSKSEINEFIDLAKHNGKHTLIVSTYHSFDKLSGINIDVFTCDEAHTISCAEDNDFVKNIKSVKDTIKNLYYFTATRRVFGDDFGMNDFDMFGKVIHEVSPKKMVDEGFICPIRVHLIKPDNDDKDYENPRMETEVIKRAFLAHEKLVSGSARVAAENGVGEGYIGAKMLVNTKGSKTIIELLSSENDFIPWTKLNNIRTFMIASSEDVGCTIDGESVDRATFVNELKNIKDEEKAIIVHIQILTEGIDLPGITGTLFMAQKSKIPLLQSTGRSLRRLAIDRANIVKNKIVSVDDKEKQVKPFGYVIIPEGLFISDCDYSKMKEIIREVSTTYEIPLDEMKIVESFKGNEIIIDPSKTSEEEPIGIRGVITELLHELEVFEDNWMEYSYIDEANDIIMRYYDEKNPIKGISEAVVALGEKEIK